jgi:TolB-like protein/Tfp pilus assembly protein PilF
LEEFLAQLRQRQVFKVATIYAVSAWPLIQIADLAVPALGLPDSVMTLLLKIFIFGFPVSLIFAWLFNFTSKGVVRIDGQQVAETNVAEHVNVRTTIAVAGTLVLALSVTLVTQLMFNTSNQAVVTENINSVTQITQPPATPIDSGKESIAILPFVALSSDPEDEFFADGMVEELLNLLAKNADLQVAARTSSFAYKNVANKTITEIGTELGVKTILEGSIRKNDVTNKIRVTAQLINVSTGEHLWSETYDREYRDVFQIQDEIANSVVEKLQITLLGKNRTNDVHSGTSSIDAMVSYGKGQKELSHRTTSSLQKALAHFSSAIAADKNYARAYVGLANANILLALYGTLEEKESHQAAQNALDKAFSLNGQLADAYASQGLLFSATNKDQAEESFKKAIALNPNYAMAYLWYGSLILQSGDIGSAHQLFEQAFELDPKSPVAAYNVAWCYYQEGSEAKAMELFSQIIANDPYYPGAYNLAGNILMKRGRLDESIEMYQRALQVDAGNKGAVEGLLIANMDMKNIEATDQWFNYINDNAVVFSDTQMYLFKARLAASKGNKQAAINYLKQINTDEKKHGKSLYIQAEIAFYQEEYAKAINAYEQLRQLPNKTSNYFYHAYEGQAAVHLTYAYQQLEQSVQANNLLSEFEQFLINSINSNENDPTLFYNMTLAKLLQNQEDEALNYFQGAIDAGWVQVWKVDLEPVLGVLVNKQRFGQMLGGVIARLENMKARAKEEASFFLVAQ